MNELIVVACNGPAWIDQCRASMKTFAPDAVVRYVDTGGSLEHGADVAISGGYPTGVLRWAYESQPHDRLLVIQDSMTVLADPLPWFRRMWTGYGAVAWQRFPMQWDDWSQAAWVETLYPDVRPSHGIFGPVLYTDRASLDVLAARDLLPPVPESRWQSQATERAWAYAFAAAGLPVAGPVWNPDQMQLPSGFGPFRKVLAGRP